MIKLESLKLMFHDLTLNEKLVFEHWIKQQISRALMYKHEKS